MSDSNSKIVFKNEPKLSPHEVDNKFNERRLKLVPQVKDYIINHPLLRDMDVSVTFAEKGVSSLVSIIETPSEKFVLKVHLSISHSLGEGMFLKVWEKAGVKVPHVIEDGVLGGHVYTLMSYIDAPMLSEIYSSDEMIEKKIYFQMGKVMRQMHVPQTEGYGRVVDGRPEFAEFTDWIMSEDMKERYDYVCEHKLLDDGDGLLDRCIAVLIEHVGKSKSSYCHDDLGSHNIFATDPITIFDPNPRFNNPYLDMGRTLCNGISHGAYLDQFVGGYFNGEPYNKKALYSAILIMAYYKLPYTHKTDRLQAIENIRTYLMQNKNILDE